MISHWLWGRDGELPANSDLDVTSERRAEERRGKGRRRGEGMIDKENGGETVKKGEKGVGEDKEQNDDTTKGELLERKGGGCEWRENSGPDEDNRKGNR